MYGLVAPPAGKVLAGKRVEISASYNTGSDEQVTDVELEIDGQPIQTRRLDPPRTRGISSFIWDASDCPNGVHRITVKLYSDGRLLGAVSGQYRVANRPPDTTPPAVTYFNVRPGQTVSGRIELKIKATDDSGEPPLVSVFIDHSLKLLKNNPPYSYIWDTTLYDDGEHQIEVWAYDAAGNRATAPALPIVVRNKMAPLKIAQNVKPDKNRAAASTTGPVPKVAPKASVPAPVSGAGAGAVSSHNDSVAALTTTTPTVKETAQSNTNQTAEPTATEPKPQEMAAIPVPLPSFEPAAARSVEPGQSTGGVALRTEQAADRAPLVEFIDEPAEVKVEASAGPSELAHPALGAHLAEANGLSPAISLPRAAAKETQVALRPTGWFEAAGPKRVPPSAETTKIAKLALEPATEVPAGRLRGEMYGREFTIDAEVNRGIPVAPLREVWEPTGGQLFWYPEKKLVKGFSREVDLELRIGDRRAIVNRVPVYMEIAPYIADGRTMVGISFLRYAFRMDLEENEKTGQLALVVR